MPINKYLTKYKLSNIFAMMRNNKRKPRECMDDYKGRLVVITGATSGIGYVTARKFAAHGANLLLINRNAERSITLCNEIRQEFGVNCDYKTADFSRLSEVRRLGQELRDSDLKMDVIIHNAGVFSTNKQITEDGNELVFQVNFLCSFLLNFMLKEKLKTQGKARIILVNSEGHRFAIAGIKLDDLLYEKHRYSGLGSYGVAKTAQLLSLIKFAEYFQESGVTINAMHPSDVKSNLGANNGRLYRWYKRRLVDPTLKSPEIAATALYYLGVSGEIESANGKFFNLTTEEEPAPPALDRDVADELWDISIKLVGLNG